MAITIDTTNKVEEGWYELLSQKKEDKPTAFKIVALTGAQLDEVMENINYESETPLTAKGVKAAMTYGVKDCRNVIGSDGKEISYYPAVTSFISWGDRQELAMAIANRSRLSGSELGNF